MSEQTFIAITKIGLLSSVIPLAVLAFSYRKAHRKLWWVLLFLALSWAVAELFNWVLTSKGQNNTIVFHLYDFVSTILYLVYFRLILQSKFGNRIMLLIALIYSTLVWFNIVYFDCYNRPITINSILTVLIPMLLTLYAFYVIIKEAQIKNLMREPVYWVNCAILIHFGISVVSNISLEMIIGKSDVQIYLWLLVIASNILHNILFSIGVWQMRRS